MAVLIGLLFLLIAVVSYLLISLLVWLPFGRWFNLLSYQLWRVLPAAIQRRLALLFDAQQQHHGIHVVVVRWLILIIFAALMTLIQGSGLWLITALLALALVISRTQNRFRAKQQRIKKELPDYCDLLAMMIAAGVPLIPALTRVADACHGGLLAAELNRVVRQLRQGVTLAEALTRLSDRYRMGLLSEWTQLLIQGHQQGSGLVSTLRFHSLQLRQQLLNEAEKKAQEAPVKLLLPLMSCFFPVNFLVILGPIVLKISQGGM